jgi:hypothetical protein
MTGPLVLPQELAAAAQRLHSHDSRVHFILDETIRDGIVGVTMAILKTAKVLDPYEDPDREEDDPVLAEARLKNLATMERLQDLAKDIAILRKMLGVR